MSNPNKQEVPRLQLSREAMADKKPDTYYDGVWVRHFIKDCQDVDPGIGGVLFGKNILVLFWNRIIIYKVLLDEFNTSEVSIKYHKEQVEKVVRMLKLNMIPLKELRNSAKNFNKNKTGKLL